MTQLIDLAALPLSFEANRGQTSDEVDFLARDGGCVIYLTPAGAVMTLARHEHRRPDIGRKAVPWAEPLDAPPGAPPIVLRLKIKGGYPEAKAEGLEELPGRTNYFIGSDPARWRTNIPTYAKVRYEGVYPGIDLVYYGKRSGLEYDFIIHPGADPRAILLEVEGGGQLKPDGRGGLEYETEHGSIRLPKPVIYQESGCERREITGGYVLLHDNLVGVALGEYDPGLALIVDPVLQYSTYLGGSFTDYGNGIAVDTNGNAYVTGETYSTDFPVAGPLQPTLHGDRDAFVSKIAPDGSALIYSTYLGGSDIERGLGIAVDSAGNAYAAGWTYSTDFPTSNPLQPANNGGADVFISKISPDGSALIYSTYLGGSSTDYGYGVAVDTSGNAYVTGVTFSTNFPTADPLQPTNHGSGDVLISKIAPDGQTLVFSTYLGGSSSDSGQGITIDTNGNIYVAGDTFSSNFPTANPLQPTYQGDRDAFVSKIAADGSALIFSTYLGGSDLDSGNGIAVDAAGNAYVAGRTYSTDFPTANPLQPFNHGHEDIFLSKIAPDGSALLFSTYLGGSSYDGGYGLAIDDAGNAYVTGETNSADFPVADPIQPTNHGSYDAYVSKIAPDGSALLFSTYLGGTSYDFGYGIAADGAGNAYVTGETTSTDFPTADPLQPTNHGYYDVFVSKIVFAAVDLAASISASPDPGLVGHILTYTIEVVNNGPDDATGVALNVSLPAEAAFVSAASSQGNCAVIPGGLACNLGSLPAGGTAVLTIKVIPRAAGTITITVEVRSQESEPRTFSLSIEVVEAVSIPVVLVMGKVRQMIPAGAFKRNLLAVLAQADELFSRGETTAALNVLALAADEIRARLDRRGGRERGLRLVLEDLLRLLPDAADPIASRPKHRKNFGLRSSGGLYFHRFLPAAKICSTVSSKGEIRRHMLG